MGQKILYSHLQQYKISCCHHRTNPFTMLISIKSREADSSRIFFFLHFVLPHFLKSTKQTSDLSINLKILLELLRRVGCNMESSHTIISSLKYRSSKDFAVSTVFLVFLNASILSSLYLCLRLFPISGHFSRNYTLRSGRIIITESNEISN